MSFVVAIEVLAGLLGLASLGLLVARRKETTPLSWVVLGALFSVQTLLHLCDALEWSGVAGMDRLGDDLRTLIPLVWLLLVLTLQRQDLVRDLAEERNLAEFFLENSPLAAVILSEDGKVLDSSRAWAEKSGTTRERLRGVSLLKNPIAPGDIVERALDVARGAARRGSSDGPIRVLWNGHEEWIEWEVSVGPGDHGRSKRTTVVVRVVTSEFERENERRQEARMIFEQQRVELVGQLAATVVHDLNNYLHAITVNAESLSLDSSYGEFDEAREAILEATSSSSDLVRSLTGLARTRGATVAVDLGNLVRSTAILVHRSMPLSVRLELTLPVSPQRVTGDRSRLQQALVNLIINARDAMPDGGTLSVEVVDDGDRASLLVKDTGVGIPPENQSRIFDRFFTTRSAQNGTGLGLALVQTVVEEHEGNLGVESVVNGGTTFRLTFPKTREGASLSLPH